MSASTVEKRRSGEATQALAQILAGGPEDSRAALATMQARGFSAKQTRGARERLQVVIEREGTRRSMRSLWRLPDAPTQPVVAAPVVHAGPALPAAPTVALHPGAGPRFARRVAFFATDRGMAAIEAAELATALAARDATGSRAGSCAECQCWSRPEWCSMRRQALDLHECGGARRDAP